jgi:hypothetical protein
LAGVPSKATHLTTHLHGVRSGKIGIVMMIYLLTAVGLSPGGSMYLHTNSTQNNTNNNGTTHKTTNVEECGPCPVFASFTLAFALQLRKNYGKTSVSVRKTSEYKKPQSTIQRTVLLTEI